MKSKILVFVFVVALVLSFFAVLKAQAFGTPQFVSLSPSQPEPVGAIVTVVIEVQWDADTQGRVCFGNYDLCVMLTGSITVISFNTSSRPVGLNPIIAEATSRTFDPAFTHPARSVFYYMLTQGTGVFTPPFVPNSAQSFDRSVPFRQGIPSLAQARQTNIPGGVDVVTYCGAMGFAGPISSPDGSTNAAFSWFCGNVPLGNFAQVCINVFGNDFVPILTMGLNSLNGWRCIEEPAAVNTNFGFFPEGLCSPLPSRVMRGGFAINTSGVSLAVHNLPAKSSFVLFSIPDGWSFSILDGPKCDDTRTWWLVAFGGDVGWLPEANGLVYNITPR